MEGRRAGGGGQARLLMRPGPFRACRAFFTPLSHAPPRRRLLRVQRCAVPRACAAFPRARRWRAVAQGSATGSCRAGFAIGPSRGPRAARLRAGSQRGIRGGLDRGAAAAVSVEGRPWLTGGPAAGCAVRVRALLRQAVHPGGKRGEGRAKRVAGRLGILLVGHECVYLSVQARVGMEDWPAARDPGQSAVVSSGRDRRGRARVVPAYASARRSPARAPARSDPAQQGLQLPSAASARAMRSTSRILHAGDLLQVPVRGSSLVRL